VVVTKGASGTLYSVLLGAGAVGAKLQAAPDSAPDQVQVALAFRVEGSAAPHQECTLVAVAGSEMLPLQAPRYERAAAQEALYGTLTLDQLDRMSAQDGALIACETRVQITQGTRAKLAALLKAVRAHGAARKVVQRGDALAL
jgi:hypothetical protein